MSVCQGAAEALDSYLQQMGVNEMGTTMALARIVDNPLILAHCGDSRILCNLAF